MSDILSLPAGVRAHGAELDQLLRDVHERRREFEALGYVPQDIIDRFKAMGVYRSLVARRFGGDECSPAEFCRLIERISQADGSTGWVASFAIGPIYLSALPVPTLERLYAEGGVDQVFAGGIFPPQPVQAVEGGYKVSGRWHFSSGSMGADVVGVGIIPPAEGGAALPRMAVMRRDQIRIEQNWDVMGLKATGSNDLVADGVVVAQDWTFVRGGASSLDTPLYRYPALAFAAQVLAVVALGIGRAAIDEVLQMAGGRKSVTGAPNLGERVYVQLEVARIEAELRAARSWFYEAIDDIWRVLVAGGRPEDHLVSMLRLSATHAARVGADVARRAQMLSGMTGVYEASPLAQQVRDAQMVTQHAFMGDITYQNAGAMRFGLAPLPGYL
ncbi:acyl-CoA dehydrogenase family protein [Castellaniella defragrans]|jgi:alkylation response protein AidB-like acyl-CoA dehydrogenase|uniref:Pigment protein n=2 Tax=Castellaniella defragrans TaxID=75697 RepID=W8X0T6_CASD6|nr:acyl-CoA dehydrogenase family protein [Castellaniella defragrans]KAB0602867.1 flavin-dependent monooxygenase [Castellaniella defragrans]MBB6082702.1 alkylation response protein AidB-like acyl-CoA dehydrogenase [Castellaniella defragrans]CDM25529.1 Pigment protein [Castellaniella defragrans 65Phen]